MLVMEVEVGKAVYLAYNIFGTNIFVLQIAYRSLGFLLNSPNHVTTSWRVNVFKA